MEEIQTTTAEEVVELYGGDKPVANQDDGENLEAVEGEMPESEEYNEESEA